MSLNGNLEAAADVVAAHGPSPRLGIVLGSGLGGFVHSLSTPVSVAYASIPGMPKATVEGHAGRLWLGTVGDAGPAVACLEGRCHLYEGHPASSVVFGVRLLAKLGATAVLLTNAAGGLSPQLKPGQLMLIVDHLNLTGQNPLVGIAAQDGQRFCDMTRAYDSDLGALAQQAADEVGVALECGVYAGVLGPSYETPAEIRMLSVLGAQAVGMSTVLETIALRQLGVRVAGISLITNLAAGLSGTELSHREVQEIAAKSQTGFARLVARWCELATRESA